MVFNNYSGPYELGDSLGCNCRSGALKTIPLKEPYQEIESFQVPLSYPECPRVACLREGFGVLGV